MSQVNCPFCDTLIESDIDVCPKCGSWFKEPELVTIKFKDFALFCALQTISFGWFSSLWFLINYGAISKLIINEKDSKKYKTLFCILLGLLTLSVLLPTFGFISIVLLYILGMALTYRILRIIQKYTLKKYNANIDFNPYYIAFFSIFYLVHFIDTYEDRVTNNHDYMNFKNPTGFVLFILLAILAFFINCCSWLCTKFLYY